MRALVLRLAGALTCLLAVACSDPAPAPRAGSDAELADLRPLDPAETLSPDAKVETHQELVADLEREASPSDGGGVARLIRQTRLAGEGPLRVGDAARFEIEYEVGPLGVATGGSIFLQSSPFWGWSSPQIERADAPGYVEVSTAAEGVTLTPIGGFESLFGVTVGGRALRAGERLRFVYGAGPLGARVDRYAERGAEISFSVDGDGDGYRRFVDRTPRIDVAAAPAAKLVVFAPTRVAPGAAFEVRAHLVDGIGNAVAAASGPNASHVEWSMVEGELPGLPTTGTFATADSTPADPDARSGAALERLAPTAPGVLRIRATGVGELEGLSATSNPIVVRADGMHVLWGDLHGHSQLSDGTGTPDDYFRYARDVAALDVSALTDHDHWGLRFLDAHPAMWDEIKAATARYHAPGRFVTLLGYEWTSWLHGHRHVLYFEEDGPVLSSMDPLYATPAQLWDGLRDRPALTFAHHSAGGPIATNWHFPPDPQLEPVTEITSVHGSSEADDSPGRIYSAVPGNSVRDALNVGYRLGFIGSGDSHDGHPGLAHIAEGGRTGGLAAILSKSRTREAVLEALRARRVYATNGSRIFLDVTLDDQTMGSALRVDPDRLTPHVLRIRVVGTAPIERVDLIRSGRRAEISGDDELEWTHEREIPPLHPGEYHYVRVIQRDGGVAWSSPFFVDAKSDAAVDGESEDAR